MEIYLVNKHGHDRFFNRKGNAIVAAKRAKSAVFKLELVEEPPWRLLTMALNGIPIVNRKTLIWAHAAVLKNIPTPDTEK